MRAPARTGFAFCNNRKRQTRARPEGKDHDHQTVAGKPRNGEQDRRRAHIRQVGPEGRHRPFRRRQLPPGAPGGLSRCALQCRAGFRLGDRRCGRFALRRGDACEACKPGLSDDGGRAGQQPHRRACHRRDDRLSQARRRGGDGRTARRSCHPHRVADDHRGRLLHRSGVGRIQSRPSRDRSRRREPGRSEDRVRPHPCRAEGAQSKCPATTSPAMAR
jgi:hypothetical protein